MNTKQAAATMTAKKPAHAPRRTRLSIPGENWPARAATMNPATPAITAMPTRAHPAFRSINSKHGQAEKIIKPQTIPTNSGL
jgi:hypothetical protein